MTISDEGAAGRALEVVPTPEEDDIPTARFPWFRKLVKSPGLASRESDFAWWSALELATWAVVDQVDHLRVRFLLLRENRDPQIPLTAREREIVEHASRGHSNKRIAHDLGVGSSTVSTHLSRAGAKLGLRTRTAIIQARKALAREHAIVSLLEVARERFAVVSVAAVPAPDTLSSAEWEVVRLVVAGESNARIAQARGVSERTVANQIASAMKKLGVGSRADMTAYLAR